MGIRLATRRNAGGAPRAHGGDLLGLVVVQRAQDPRGGHLSRIRVNMPGTSVQIRSAWPGFGRGRPPRCRSRRVRGARSRPLHSAREALGDDHALTAREGGLELGIWTEGALRAQHGAGGRDVRRIDGLQVLRASTHVTGTPEFWRYAAPSRVLMRSPIAIKRAWSLGVTS